MPEKHRSYLMNQIALIDQEARQKAAPFLQELTKIESRYQRRLVITNLSEAEKSAIAGKLGPLNVDPPPESRVHDAPKA